MNNEAGALVARIIQTAGGAVNATVVVELPAEDRASRDRSAETTGVFAAPAWLPGDRLVGPPAAVATRVGGLEANAVLVLSLVRPRSLGRDGLLEFLRPLLDAVPASARVAFLVPTTVLEGESSRSLRAAWVRDRHVSWIVWLGRVGATSLDVHGAFSTALLVLEPRAGSALTRLVTLRDVHAEDTLAVMARCAARNGGEVGPSIVLRNVAMDDGAWTFSRFSRSTQEAQVDSAELGQMVPLSEFADIRMGLRPAGAGFLEPLPAEDVRLPLGKIACYSGRSIGTDRLVPTHMADEAKVDRSELLAEGDVLVRSVRAPGERLRATVVHAEDLPAAACGSVLLVRLRDREYEPGLLRAYLASRRTTQLLEARGLTGVHVLGSMLGSIEVPKPKEAVSRALSVLKDHARQHTTWAEEADLERERFFVAESYRQAIPELLEAVRRSTERLAAAKYATTSESRIRAAFPHPIVHRREVFLQLDHGQPRVSDALECAEHFIGFLSLLAFVATSQLKDGKPFSAWSGDRDDRFTFDWGKAVALLQQVAAKSANCTNPLQLGFPEFAELHRLFIDEESGWNLALRELMLHRNNHAHLHRATSAQLEEFSPKATGHLDLMLDACSFLSATPLVHVLDYGKDALTGTRSVTLALMVGLSSAFRREVRVVDAEWPRDAVGVIDTRGVFHDLSPWVIRRRCDACKHAETFIFNRLDRSGATYVAMETGHPITDTALAAPIRKSIRARA